MFEMQSRSSLNLKCPHVLMLDTMSQMETWEVVPGWRPQVTGARPSGVFIPGYFQSLAVFQPTITWAALLHGLLPTLVSWIPPKPWVKIKLSCYLFVCFPGIVSKGMWKLANIHHKTLRPQALESFQLGEHRGTGRVKTPRKLTTLPVYLTLCTSSFWQFLVVPFIVNQ